MKKLKFFVSLLKERDWLEEMATQGWLLTDIKLGMLYYFKKVEPCEKVYEIERFAVTSNSTISDITARTRALDITSQFGWDVVTHDENLNYYFVKDKTGDETDEFYDSPEDRQERAERFRKNISMETPLMLLPDLIIMSALLVIIYLIVDKSFSQGILIAMLSLYIGFSVAISCLYMKWGQQIYSELCMSRDEWTQYKNNSEKKKFKKIQHLHAYLHEKSELGLSLKGYENGCYIFEEDTQQYNYFVDTKRCFKKRLKKDNLKFTEEDKDLLSQSLKWHEMSIANAAQYNLKPVAAIGNSILIYKRPLSDDALPWENGNENVSPYILSNTMFIILTISIMVGFVGGFLLSIID